MMNRRNFVGLVLASGSASSPWGGGGRFRSRTSLDAANGWDPWIEIDTRKLISNLEEIRRRVRKPVTAVVKANGYGHGLAGVARSLEEHGIRNFLVGKLQEAQELREAVPRSLILNFGPFDDSEAEEIIRLRISQSVRTQRVRILWEMARKLRRNAHVHIHVDTGLGRAGVPHKEALSFLDKVSNLSAVVIDGVFTSFTEDPDFDRLQLSRFLSLRSEAKRHGIAVNFWHAASSDGILHLPPAFEQLDAVRPGIMLYGLYPSLQAEGERELNLQPVMALKARIMSVRTLEPGDSVSYHRAFIAEKRERVATLPIGYSDGFPHGLEKKGFALISGRRCPIVAMNSNLTMVRLGDTQTALGGEAVLIGNQMGEQISVSEIARLIGRSVYSVVMGMSGLLPRVYM